MLFFFLLEGVPKAQQPTRCGRLCGLFVTASGKGAAAGRRESCDVEANEDMACELQVEANEEKLVPCKVLDAYEAEANEGEACKIVDACEVVEANEPEDACKVEAYGEGEVNEIEANEPIEQPMDL
jgi:hypothetical protein